MNRSVVTPVSVQECFQHDFVIVKVALLCQAEVPVKDDADGQCSLRWICTVPTNDALDLLTQKARGLHLAYSTFSTRISKAQCGLSHRH